MSNIHKRIVNVFYIILSTSVILYLIPGRYKIAVYGMNYLGWITVASVILTFVLFIILSYLDIKNQKFKSLFKRLAILAFIIVFCKIISYYDEIRNDSLNKKDLKETIDK
jgi:phosphoglycerol transferase MdoB-like AlkP superfamily enzyme